MSRPNRALMITDSNQVCLAKMTGRRVQEELFSMDLKTVFLDLVLEGTHGCKEVNHLT
jgi:hypothetical protein